VCAGDAARHPYWRQDWYVWNNDRDTRLRNRSGKLIDRCSYSGSSVDFEVC
jgi:hypothetical protein